ncbi:MAG: hypothetical protein ACRER2_05190 [Methylococcales bacterium]
MTIGRSFYPDYERIIEDPGGEFSASDSLGLIAGMLCANPSPNFRDWEHELRTSAILPIRNTPE